MKNLKSLGKRGLAWFLSLVMCISLLPVNAMAADVEDGHDHVHAEDTLPSADGETGEAQEEESFLDKLGSAIGDLFGGGTNPLAILPENTETVTYQFYASEADAAAGTSPIYQQTVKTDPNYNEQLQLPADPYQEGQKFVRWTTDGNDTVTGGAVTGTGIVKVYPVFETVYKATFVGANGRVYHEATVEQTGGKYTVYQPDINYEPAAGMSFDGWSVNGVKVEFPYEISADTTFTALEIAGTWVRFETGEGGSYVMSVQPDADGKVKKPADPTREGYEFTGNWLLNGIVFNFDTDTVISDVTLVAEWTPANVSYTVVYWAEKANIAGTPNKETDYTRVATKSHSGLVGETAEYDPVDWTGTGIDGAGMKSPTADTVTVKADGTTVVNVYYDRDTFEFTFQTPWFGWHVDKSLTIRAKYGADISKQWPSGDNWKKGKDITSARQLPLSTMPANGGTCYYALLEGTTVSAHYYLQNLDGSYPADGKGIEVQKNAQIGNKDKVLVEEADYLEYVGFELDRENANTTTVGQKYNGAKFYYKRIQSTITYQIGTEVVGTSAPVYYQAPLAAYGSFTPSVVKDGYRFEGTWYENAACTAEVDWNGTMPASDKIVYGKWVPEKTFTVSLSNVKGNPADVLTVDKDTPVKLSRLNSYIQHPDDKDEQFIGWYWNNVRQDVDFTINQSITLEARWTGDVYTVSYDAGVTDTNQYSLGATATVKDGPAAAADPDQIFRCWKDSATGTDYWPGMQITVNGNIKLVAQYDSKSEQEKEQQVTLTYLPGDGTGTPVTLTRWNNEKIQLWDGKNSNGEMAFTREGYDLTGWSDGKETYEPGATVVVDNNSGNTLTAVWTRKTYTVTYEWAKNGNVPSSAQLQLPKPTTVSHGDKVTLPTMSEVKDYDEWGNVIATYTFQGWNPTETTITSNTTFIGTWTKTETPAQKWKVKYALGEGVPESVTRPQEQTYTNNQDLNLDTSLNGKSYEVKDQYDNVTDVYTFKEWTLTSGTIGTDNKVTGNLTYTAQWTRKEVTVLKHTVSYDLNVPTGASFDANGASKTLTAPDAIPGLVKNQPYSVDTSLVGEKLYTKDEYGNVNGYYELTSWNDPNSGVMGEKDVTVTAQWSQLVPVPVNKWTVTFAAGNGTTDTTVKVVNGAKVAEPAVNPTKEGHDFQGWYNGNSKYDFNTAVTSDITLTADWSLKKFQVKWMNGTTLVATQEYKYGAQLLGFPTGVTPPSKTPTTEEAKTICSYTLKWERTGEIGPDNTIIGDITYYAQFTEVKHQWSAWSVIKIPTETENGTMERTCTSCQKTETATLPKLEVNQTEGEWKLTAYKVPTCTVPGSATFTKVDQAGNAVVPEEKVEATIAALSHNMTKTDAKPATCTDPGNVEYWTCSNACCDGLFFEDQAGNKTLDKVTIDKLNHNYGAPVWSWAVAKDGYTLTEVTATFTCDHDESHVVTLMMTQNDVTVTNEKTSETCGVAGAVTYTASVTFEEKTYTAKSETYVIPATGNHNFAYTWTLTRDGDTLTAVGKGTCTCGQTDTQTGTAFVNNTSTPPTCLKEGTGTATVNCSGKIFAVSDVTIPALGHDWATDWSATDETGHYHVCQRPGCGEHDTTESHTYDSWEVTKHPTTTESGEAVETCQVCGYEHKVTLAPVDPDKLPEGWTKDDSKSTEPNCNKTGEYVYNTPYGIVEVVIPVDSTKHDWDTAWYNEDNGTHWHVCKNGCGHRDAEAAHDYGSWQIIEQPGFTELALGTAKRICETCKYEDIKKIPGLVTEGEDAKWTKERTDDPTCTKVGTDVYTSTLYDGLTISVEVSKLPHNLSKVDAKEANCVADGNLEYWVCESCKGLFSDAAGTTPTTLEAVTTTAPNNHDWDTENWVCTDGGSEHWRECKNGCGSRGESAAHAFGDWQIITAPGKTPFAVGLAQRTCEGCGLKEDKTLPGLNPDDLDENQWTKTSDSIEPTCTTKGTYYYSLVADPSVIVTVTIEKLGHDMGEWSIVKYPTDTEEGTAKRDCKRENCDYSETKDLAALGTDPENPGEGWTLTATVAPDCENDGYYEYTHTETSLKARVVLPALKHDWTDWNVTKTPTETETGTMERECKRENCDKTESVTLPMLTEGETSGDWTLTAYTAPTCTEAGSATFTKVNAETQEIVETYTMTLAATGHAYGAWAIVAAPTVDATGLARRVCANDASHVLENVLDRLPATPDEITGSWTLTRTVDPTCEAAGYYEYAHTVTLVTARVARAALGHSWNGGVVTTPATYTSTGVMTYTCTRNATHTRTETIPMLSSVPTFPAPDGSDSGTGSGTGTGGTTIDDNDTPLTSGEDIFDRDVPLANVTGLNTEDHYAYVQGDPDGKVRPLDNITRAEVATIFFRLMTEEYRVANWSVSNSFTDAVETDWYNAAVSTAAKAGLIKGYPDGTVRPDVAITHAEFVVLASRFFSDELTDEGVADYNDTAGIEWAAPAIRKAAKAGWITWVENGNFRPDEPITRAEVMMFINRMLDRVPSVEGMLEGMKTWTDNPEGTAYYADVLEATNDHSHERAEDGVTEVWTELVEKKDWSALEAEWKANNGASVSAAESDSETDAG